MVGGKLACLEVNPDLRPDFKQALTATNDNDQNPVGVIAIGHSEMTGEGPDPTRPGQEARENSWATGTAPEVNSVYERLLAVGPEIAGHVAYLARGGAPITALGSQAQSALHMVPNPELVLIQTIDNDIRCDGSDRKNVKTFGVAFAKAYR